MIHLDLLKNRIYFYLSTYDLDMTYDPFSSRKSDACLYQLEDNAQGIHHQRNLTEERIRFNKDVETPQ